MSNIFDLAKKIQSSITTGTESDIVKKSKRGVDPIKKARDVFLMRLQENIDGLQALKDGDDWPKHPVKKEGGRETAYVKWFDLNEDTDKYELRVLYNRKPIAGLLGYEKSGEPTVVLKGLTKASLPKILKAIKAEAEKGAYDDYLLAAKEAITARMKAAREANKKGKLEAVA